MITGGGLEDYVILSAPLRHVDINCQTCLSNGGRSIICKEKKTYTGVTGKFKPLPEQRRNSFGECCLILQNFLKFHGEGERDVVSNKEGLQKR